MAGKIFYRERRKVEDGEKKPRFRVAAIFDCNLKIHADHFRMSELEHIAVETGAQLIPLQKGKKKTDDA